jgi:hypothetical protein
VDDTPPVFDSCEVVVLAGTLIDARICSCVQTSSRAAVGRLRWSNAENFGSFAWCGLTRRKQPTDRRRNGEMAGIVQDRLGARLGEAKLPSLHDCRSRRPGRCPKDLVPWSSLLHSFIFPSSIFSSIHLTSDTCIKYHHALDASRYAIEPRQICLKDGVTMRHESVHFYRHPGPDTPALAYAIHKAL